MSTLREEDVVSLTTEYVVNRDTAVYRSAVRSAIASGRPHDGRPSPLHAFVLAQSGSFAAVNAVLAHPDNRFDPVVVHIDQRIDIDRLLQPDEPLTLTFAVLGARRDPRGTRLCFSITVCDLRSARVAYMETGVLALGANHLEPFGRITDRLSLPPVSDRPAIEQRWVLDHGFVSGYAAAAGDHNPIHLDVDSARAAGFDAVVAHGMSVVSLLTELAIDHLGNGRADSIAGVGCRFVAPILVDDPIDVALQPTSDPHLFRAVCQTSNGPALRNAWIRLRQSEMP
jgi:MaoC like domain